ncbi:MAG TPA: nitrate ABC transporter ATP-binding protein [Polyangiaceae bacterium]|jgi:nitrate ABC transporter ATP-binding subunit
MNPRNQRRYLELSQLGKIFPTANGPAVIVEGFDLRVAQGEFVCLIGHSGCGKSTVLSMVAGLSEPTTGAIILAGREIDGAGPDRGMVFQTPCLLPWLTALENVRLAVDQVRPGTRDARSNIARHYLELVGLGASVDRRPAELSAGMRQRVSLARAFALSPKLLLLDEPFGALDSLTRMDLQEVLLELWARNKKTAFMVTHDVDEALFLADRIAMMTNGPAARLGDVLQVPFPRPRNRAALLENPSYYGLREQLIGFLTDQAPATQAKAVENALKPGLESEAHALASAWP